MSRATKDVDGLVRGELDRFITELDEALDEPWGPLRLERAAIEVISVPDRVVKPRRFDILVKLNGVTWRRIKVEIAADEAGAGRFVEYIVAPTLAGFGLPTPETLAVLSLRYQIAQKIHAGTDPHSPPEIVNDRARDLVDLLLLKELCEGTGEPTPEQISDAVVDVF